MCNTYGTWLRGDRLGWRERHHRSHVEGDYKYPPKPGAFEALLARSQRLLKRDPIHLDRALRAIALRAAVQTLAGDGVKVLIEHGGMMAEYGLRRRKRVVELYEQIVST